MNLKITPPDFIRSVAESKTWGKYNGESEKAKDLIRYGVNNYTNYLLTELFEMINSIAIESTLTGTAPSSGENGALAKVENFSFTRYHHSGYAQHFETFIDTVNEEFPLDSLTEDDTNIKIVSSITEAFVSMVEEVHVIFYTSNKTVSEFIIGIAEDIYLLGGMGIDTTDLIDRFFSSVNPLKTITTRLIKEGDFEPDCDPVDFRLFDEADTLPRWERLCSVTNHGLGRWYMVTDDGEIFTTKNCLPRIPRKVIYTAYKQID